MQNLLNLLLQFLKSLLAGFWEIFKIGLWLLIQLIEMSAWILSILSKKIKRTHRLLRISLKRNKMAVFLAPFKQLLRAIWTGIVIVFWLLIQIIELFVWVLSSLGSSNTGKTPPSQNSQEDIPLPPSVKLRRQLMSERSPNSPTPEAISQTTINPSAKLSDRLLNSFWQKIPVLIIFSLLLPAIFTLAKAIVPNIYPFEGNLIVEEMNFTYAGDRANQPFLNAIGAIERLEIEGTQEFTLTGQFQSESNPGLNSSKKLKIQLPNGTSQLIIEPAKPQQSQLQLMQLQLQPNTQVNRLRYIPEDRQLAFSLQPNESKQPNLLKLSLGEQPLKAILKDYRLPGRVLKDSKIPNNLEFILTPTASEVNLSLPQLTSLAIALPETPSENTDKWLQGEIAVNNVNFERERQPNNATDKISTIIAGKVRLAGQELAIESTQFLLAGKPGIEQLQSLQISGDKTQGLEVSIQGESETVKIGLNPESPIKEIPTSFVNRYLSRDGAIALLAFCIVAIVSLLPWLLIQFIKK